MFGENSVPALSQQLFDVKLGNPGEVFRLVAQGKITNQHDCLYTALKGEM